MTRLIVRRRATGYTLLELTVVLVIVSLAVAVAAPSLAGARAGRDIDRAGAALADALRRTHRHAILGARDAELDIAPSLARAWMRPGDTSFVLPLPAGCILEGEARMTMRFAPDGSAMGSVPQVRCGADRSRVVVDALTGTTRVEALR